jgi:hypothetical protein
VIVLPVVQLRLRHPAWSEHGDDLHVYGPSPDGNVSGANSGNYTTTTAYNNDDEETSVIQGNGSGYTGIPAPPAMAMTATGTR